MIGMDSTLIIDLYKGDEKARKAIKGAREPLASTIINYQELMFGIDLKKSGHAEEMDYYDAFFENIFLLEMTRESAKKAAGIAKELRSTGKEAGRFDAMIAGILIQNGVRKIITRNTKHFNSIKGIETITY